MTNITTKNHNNFNAAIETIKSLGFEVTYTSPVDGSTDFANGDKKVSVMQYDGVNNELIKITPHVSITIKENNNLGGYHTTFIQEDEDIDVALERIKKYLSF